MWFIFFLSYATAVLRKETQKCHTKSALHDNYKKATREVAG